MLQALDYSVTLDTSKETEEGEGCIKFFGVHEAADGNNHPVTIMVNEDNKETADLMADLLQYSIDEDDLVTVGVTGKACPEISAALIEVPGKTQNGKDLPDTEETCAQCKMLIIDAQTVRQKDPDEPVSSTVVAIGIGKVNDYLPRNKDGENGSVKVPDNYMVCDELHLCIPAMSELNETVDPMKIRAGEGLPVGKFFEPATEENMPSAFPSGYVCVTGLLEFGEGGFYNSRGNAVAYSRLRLVATDVIPLGIAPNGKAEGKRQVQMLSQRKKVVRFGDKSEDKAPKKRRSLSELKY